MKRTRTNPADPDPMAQKGVIHLIKMEESTKKSGSKQTSTNGANVGAGADADTRAPKIALSDSLFS